MGLELSDISSKNNKGKVSCNSDILLSIVSLATKEITGVSCLCQNFGNGLKKIFSNNYTEGVKITEVGDEILVDIYINILFGYSVADVAFRVQENVKNGLSSMVDIKINSINVHVLGVDFKPEGENN
ncbi:MAG: Asp23/Gls24 family envelope stress response protein [Clostridiales bacterium]|nr:Asp23/Gls24 family envelope stress response protein [Candidatus Apopatousia equi]